MLHNLETHFKNLVKHSDTKDMHRFTFWVHENKLELFYNPIRHSVWFYKANLDAGNGKYLKFVKNVSIGMVRKFIDNEDAKLDDTNADYYLTILKNFGCLEKSLELALEIYVKKFSHLSRSQRTKNYDYQMVCQRLNLLFQQNQSCFTIRDSKKAKSILLSSHKKHLFKRYSFLYTTTDKKYKIKFDISDIEKFSSKLDYFTALCILDTNTENHIFMPNTYTKNAHYE